MGKGGLLIVIILEELKESQVARTLWGERGCGEDAGEIRFGCCTKHSGKPVRDFLSGGHDQICIF